MFNKWDQYIEQTKEQMMPQYATEFHMMRERIFNELWAAASNYDRSREQYKTLAYNYFMAIPSSLIIETYINHDVAFKACLALAIKNAPQGELKKK